MQLSPWFSEVTLSRYEDALAVTEIEPLVEYLLSGSAADAAERWCGADEFGRRASDLIERLDQQLTSRGAILNTKGMGLFVARK